MKLEMLAVDPGLRRDRANLGWALFVNGVLVDGAVARSASDLVGYGTYPFQNDDSVHHVVIEVPRWYPRVHKIDTNDLLDLSILAGEIAGRFTMQGAVKLLAAPHIELVYPRTWKGTVPKTIHNRRVLEALTLQELALLPKRPRAKDYDNNMVDAVGIGLWKLGRM